MVVVCVLVLFALAPRLARLAVLAVAFELEEFEELPAGAWAGLKKTG